MRLANLINRISVYPLAFINLALYALWVVPARDVLKNVLFLIYTDSNVGGSRSFNVPYIVRSIDNVFWLVIAVGFLAMFVLTEYHYNRANNFKDLLRRFVRILSIQVIIIGLFMMVLDLMISQLPSIITWFALGSGVALWAVTLLKEQPRSLTQ